MKLTKAIKQQIVDNAIAKAGIVDRQEALRAQRAEWAEKVRLEALGGPEAEQRMLAAVEAAKADMASVPKRMVNTMPSLRRDTDIMLNIAGMRVRTFWCGSLCYDDARANLQSKLTVYEYTMTAENPLVAEFHAMNAEQDEINAARSAVTANVSGALSGVTTDKRLLEVWPEAVELLPEQVAESRNTLPAVRVDELNALIGLPSTTD